MACTMNTQPLGEADATTFIKKHLERANAPKELIHEDAIAMIAAKTRGNRREMLNSAAVLLTEISGFQSYTAFEYVS